MAGEPNPAPRAIGRYVLSREIAHGGMATVHLGRLRGPSGFMRTVAIKRLHPQYARDPEFVTMFLDEARLATRVQHPNVVDVLDVVAVEGELFLVMDYVHGESLTKLLLMSREQDVPVLPRIVTAIGTNFLDGLHAAHEARNERGEPLGIVHRDVSPHNVMVGADGVARVLDFGIAKASERARDTTGEGQTKGKIPYMAPEQVAGDPLDRRTDVYAASAVIWEALTGKRFMPAGDMIAIARLILTREHAAPSAVHPGVPPELDAVVLKGLARDPANRWQTAHAMAEALERAWPVGSAREVSEWVKRVAAGPLAERASFIAEIESSALPAMTRSDPPRSGPIRIAAPKAAPVAPDETPGTVETGPGAPRRNATVWVAIAGGGIIGGLLVVGLITASGSKSGAAPASSGPAIETSAAVPPAPPPAPDPPPPSASAPAQAATAMAEPSVSAVPPARRFPTHPTRLSAPAGCNPPYTIDANGVRVPKRQCF